MTNPPKDLYDPAMAVAGTHDLVSQVCPAIHEVVCQGAAIFARCLATTEVDSPTQAPFMAYHQFLELLDGVHALLKVGRTIAARPLLRGVFEALLALEYLLEGDQQRRGYAYRLAHYYEELRGLRRCSPGSPERSKLDEAAHVDQSIDENLLPTIPDAPDQIRQIREHLSRGPWKETVSAWKVTKQKKHGRTPNWYELYEGPGNLRQLAERLRHPYFYELMYGHWSKTSHAQDFGRLVEPVNRQEATFATIPNWRDINKALTVALSLGVRGNRIFLTYFRGEEAFLAKWYAREIQAAFVILGRELSRTDGNG